MKNIMKNKGKYIFDLASVQCGICGRFFIKEISHKCKGGFRKHHFKWIKLK